MTTNGAFALFNALAMFRILFIEGMCRDALGCFDNVFDSVSWVPIIKSAGKSTNPVPGRPKYACRYASAIKFGIRSGLGGRMANFVCGVNSATASISTLVLLC